MLAYNIYIYALWLHWYVKKNVKYFGIRKSQKVTTIRIIADGK
jgi:hypothetical protein